MLISTAYTRSPSTQDMPSPTVPGGEAAYDFIPSPLGPLLLVVGEAGLLSLTFHPTDRDLQRIQARSGLTLVRRQEVLAPVGRQIGAYFRQGLDRFDLPVDLQMLSDEERRVLELCSEIPYGQLSDYQTLAAKIGRPGEPMAAAVALLKNPLPLIIPCHRVIGEDGSLGGYGARGGLETKRVLLVLEGALI